MDKSTERRLAAWLKRRALPARRGLLLSGLAGLVHGLLILLQAWLLATILHGLVIQELALANFHTEMLVLVILYPFKGLAQYLKEHWGFEAGARLRTQLRDELLNHLDRLGPAEVQRQAIGQWSTLLMDQVEKLQDYYAKYLPQMVVVATLPFAILALVYPINWASGLIFTLTAPLTVVFMILVGMGAADANRRNFLALARLSGFFLDRVRGLDTLRQFDRVDDELAKMNAASDQFRRRTMEVLRMAFLSSAVLEFFAAISIAVVAVYFGFSFLGELNFGHYGDGVPLFTGLLVLMLAPEFFQPFRELGAHYHAKAQALGAAEALAKILAETSPQTSVASDKSPALARTDSIHLVAQDLQVLALDGSPLTRPVSFEVLPGECLTVSGASGSGKSALIKALLGFLPYHGSLTVNGVEIATMKRADWLRHVSWLDQSPRLQPGTLADNLMIAKPDASDSQIRYALEQAQAWGFVQALPGALGHTLGDDGRGLSVGQAQRIALTRTLLKDSPLLLLDEPSASLDRENEMRVEAALASHRQGRTTVWISHRTQQWRQGDHQLVMEAL